MRRIAGRVTGLALFWVAIAGWTVGGHEVGLFATPTEQRGTGPGSGRGRGLSEPGPGLIVGRVVDADSGAAVSGAEIVPAVRSDVPAPPGVRLLTGADGRFVIRDVPVGNVQLSVTAPGYLNGTSGQTRPGGPSRPVQITAKSPVIDVTVRLWKPATLTGQVTDEANEPAINVLVQAMRQSWSNGRARYVVGGTGRTDDRGIYRISGLTPGNYIALVPQTMSTLPVSAMNAMLDGVAGGQGLAASTMELAASGLMPTAGIGVRVEDQMVSAASGAMPVVGGDGRMAAYLTQYYPAATSPDTATVLTVGSGEVRGGIDLRMPLAPTVTIRGTVLGPDGPMRNVAVRLVPASVTDDQGTMSDVARAATAADGSFQMFGVPVGAYTLKVLRTPRAPVPAALAGNAQLQALLGGRGGGPASPSDDLTLFATEPVSAERDVAGLVISLATGATVSGRLEFLGSAAAVTLTGMNVTLTPVDGTAVRASPARVTADGQFKTVGFPPGRYVMTSAGRAPGWFLKSVMVNGVNALERPFELTTEDVGNVVVTFTDRQTRLTGTVTDASGSPAQGSVVMFPSDYRAWIAQGMLPRLMRNIRTQPNGSFSVAGISARDYLVVALTDEDVPDVQDPAVFESLARAATTVTIADGESRSVALKLAEVRR